MPAFIVTGIGSEGKLQKSLVLVAKITVYPHSHAYNTTDLSPSRRKKAASPTGTLLVIPSGYREKPKRVPWIKRATFSTCWLTGKLLPGQLQDNAAGGESTQGDSGRRKRDHTAIATTVSAEPEAEDVSAGRDTLRQRERVESERNYCPCISPR